MSFPVLNFPVQKLYETGQWADVHLNPRLKDAKSQAEFVTLMKDSTWWDVLKGNMAGFFYRYGYLFFVSRVPKVLGMFLIGYVVGRSDFYKNIVQHKKILYRVIGIGLVIGLPANYFLAHYMAEFEGDYYNLKTNGLYETIVYALGVAPLALAYVSLFMLSFKTVAGKKILSVLAPVGKMAFSNYIMQSLTGNFVFLGAGLGYMGQVGPVYYTLFGCGFFCIQIIISTIWLRYFNYGPVEWLWRSATYKQWQRLKKQKKISAPG
jgi:uncharacterized protein